MCAAVQALGCVLFLLCFNEHPFEDSAKLRIINANYNIPSSDTEYSVFHELIRMCNPYHALLCSHCWLLVTKQSTSNMARNHSFVTARNTLHMP